MFCSEMFTSQSPHLSTWPQMGLLLSLFLIFPSFLLPCHLSCSVRQILFSLIGHLWWWQRNQSNGILLSSSLRLCVSLSLGHFLISSRASWENLEAVVAAQGVDKWASDCRRARSHGKLGIEQKWLRLSNPSPLAEWKRSGVPRMTYTNTNYSNIHCSDGHFQDSILLYEMCMKLGIILQNIIQKQKLGANTNIVRHVHNTKHVIVDLQHVWFKYIFMGYIIITQNILCLPPCAFLVCFLFMVVEYTEMLTIIPLFSA